MTRTQVTVSPAKLTMNANKGALIVADVEFSTCSDSSKSQLLFRWEQIPTDDGVTARISPGLNLAAATSSSLHFLQDSFASGHSYRLRLTTTQSGNAGAYVETTYDFTIGVLPLLASIQGGDMIKVGKDSAIVLDGSKSADPNIDPSADQGLTYTWSCAFDDGFLVQQCVQRDGSILSLGTGIYTL